MKSPRGLTAYQVEILQHLQRATEAEPLDFDQLLDLLSWSPSKQSAQFSLRAMAGKGLIAKTDDLYLRRGRKRVCWVLAKEGALALDPRLAAAAPEKGRATPPDGGKAGPALTVSADLVESTPIVPGLPELEEIQLPATEIIIED